jgi:hypothetical protein
MTDEARLPASNPCRSTCLAEILAGEASHEELRIAQALERTDIPRHRNFWEPLPQNFGGTGIEFAQKG